MTAPLPPGDPGGGITGVVPVPVRGGDTVMPGSTLPGGAMVPRCLDKVLLRSFDSGAIFSGGVVDVLGGATGTAGLVGAAVCGLWPSAGVVASSAVRARIRGFMPDQRTSVRVVPGVAASL